MSCIVQGSEKNKIFIKKRCVGFGFNVSLLLWTFRLNNNATFTSQSTNLVLYLKALNAICILVIATFPFQSSHSFCVETKMLCADRQIVVGFMIASFFHQSHHLFFQKAQLNLLIFYEDVVQVFLVVLLGRWKQPFSEKPGDWMLFVGKILLFKN